MSTISNARLFDRNHYHLPRTVIKGVAKYRTQILSHRMLCRYSLKFFIFSGVIMYHPRFFIYAQVPEIVTEIMATHGHQNVGLYHFLYRKRQNVFLSTMGSIPSLTLNKIIAEKIKELQLLAFISWDGFKTFKIAVAWAFKADLADIQWHLTMIKEYLIILIDVQEYHYE